MASQNTYSHLYSPAVTTTTTAITKPHDPFAILSDLEITLVLGYLSAQDIVCIRRVSTLWKTCVEFRLSRAAIGRYFPGAPEAGTVYAGLEEEALAFIRLARIYGTRAKPVIARKFEVQREGRWCICNHHLVWADDTHINIQRLQDPSNPARNEFPTKRRSLAGVKFEGQPWSVKTLRVGWIAEDNKNEIIVLHIGLPFRRRGPNPHWLLAIYVPTCKILWHRKHEPSIIHPCRSRGPGFDHKNDSTLVSFGHGKVCFVDTLPHAQQASWCQTHCAGSSTPHDHFVVLDVFTGKEEVRHPMPDTHFRLSCELVYDWGDRHAAHPTEEVYFLLMGQVLWVFSTRTGHLIHSRASPFDPPDDNGGGYVSFHRGGKNQIWVYTEKAGLVLSSEIETGEFRFSALKTWSMAPNDNCVESVTQKPWEWKQGQRLTQLDPATGVAYVAELWAGESADDLATWRIMVVEFEPAEGALDHHIRTCEFLTLPAKKKGPVTEAAGAGSETYGEKDDVERQSGRRQFRPGAMVFNGSSRFFWKTGPYMMLETYSGHLVYALGFAP